MNKQVLIPDIGDFENVEIIEIMVKPGDTVKKNDPLITIESDKSSVEVPSIDEGIVEKINVKIGDKVSKGDLILSVSGERAEVNDDRAKSSKGKLPSDTEKIIQQAEESLEKKEEEVDTRKIDKKKNIMNY